MHIRCVSSWIEMVRPADGDQSLEPSSRWSPQSTWTTLRVIEGYANQLCIEVSIYSYWFFPFAIYQVEVLCTWGGDAASFSDPRHVVNNYFLLLSSQDYPLPLLSFIMFHPCWWVSFYFVFVFLIILQIVYLCPYNEFNFYSELCSCQGIFGDAWLLLYKLRLTIENSWTTKVCCF
jgi:hypothetical protein